MEYKDLGILWKQYDEKLDNLEKLNKKLLKETLLQKPQKKLKWLEYRGLYSVIAIPIILPVTLHPLFKMENINWVFILGCILTFLVALYLFIMVFRNYSILRKIDLHTDSVMKSLNEITKFKEILNTLQKSVFITYPVLFAGIMMMGWNSFVFSTNKIILVIVLVVITHILGIWNQRRHKEKISKLEKDIMELKEYTEVVCNVQECA